MSFRSAGEKRYRISFRERVAQKSTASGHVPTTPNVWKENVYAKREITSGAEGSQAGGTQAGQTATWTVDFSSERNPTTQDEILHRDAVYQIDSVMEDEQERQLEIQSTRLAVIAE